MVSFQIWLMDFFMIERIEFTLDQSQITFLIDQEKNEAIINAEKCGMRFPKIAIIKDFYALILY